METQFQQNFNVLLSFIVFIQASIQLYFQFPTHQMHQLLLLGYLKGFFFNNIFLSISYKCFSQFSIHLIVQLNSNINCATISQNIVSMQKIRHFVHQFDMFASIPSLRAHGEPELTNFCGGLFSLLILTIFLYIFIDMNIQTVRRQKIQANQRIRTDAKRVGSQNLTLLGISIQDFSAFESQPYIRVNLYKNTFNGTKVIDTQTYKTSSCNQSQWNHSLGDQYQAYHRQYNFSSMICLAEGQKISLESNLTSGVSDVVLIDIEPCNIMNGSKYNNCASNQQIEASEEAYVAQNLYFVVYFLFINTAFDGTSQNPVVPVLSTIRATFTTTRGSQILIPLNHYQIETDQSLLPFEEIKVIEGWYIGNLLDASFQTTPNSPYVRVGIILGQQIKVIERVIGKVDQILSYVGGLFGIIISLFGFFLLSFNEYRYELMVGQNAFNYSSDGVKFQQKDFSFLYYLKYSLYDWLTTLLCCQLGEWGRCKQIHETREEVIEQLDVKYLFKRLQHHQRAIEYILSPEQKISIYLTEPPSMQEVRRNRKISEYYDSIIKGKSALTIEDIDNFKLVFDFGVELGKLQQRNVQKSVLTINNSKKNKKGFPRQVEKSRQNILNFALDQFQNEAKFTETPQEASQEQDSQIEKELAQALYGMPQQLRRRIQEKIPLKILNRLKHIYNRNHQQERLMINLDI